MLALCLACLALAVSITALCVAFAKRRPTPEIFTAASPDLPLEPHSSLRPNANGDWTL